MHEFGITSRIVQAAAKAAEENGASKVLRVDLLIGQLTFLSIPQVKLAYDILVKGTPLEGSELAVEESEGLARCANCGHETPVQMRLTEDSNSLPGPLPLFSCPECGSKVDVVKGKECQITGIAIETL
ncbi:MAG: hydrogenase maturation nickel metallochaperone HypA [Chloroflexi bacterium]|nr:hydrogenase maturation nickel metallochaperone HypA [Chloroflexota bacterium]